MLKCSPVGVEIWGGIRALNIVHIWLNSKERRSFEQALRNSLYICISSVVKIYGKLYLQTHTVCKCM